MSSVRDYFDAEATAFDDAYDEPAIGYHLIRRRAVLLEEIDRLGEAAAGTWLEAGCGTGRLVCALAKRGHHVVGCDVSGSMLVRARRNVERLGFASRVVLAQSSLFALPVPSASMSGATCAGVIEYFDDPGPALSELARVLRPGGHLAVTFNNAISPFRWAMRPAKILAARVRGYPVQKNHPYTTARAHELLRAAGLEPVRWRFHTFTTQVRRDRWFPSIPIARRAEALADVPIVRQLAWGLVAVARKPDPSR